MTDTHTPFRLGDWLVEPDLNRLSNDRETAQLEPKTMAVLVYLCQRQGQVVNADEIIAEVWDGRPMGDNPVYKSIAKLRRALGDNPNDPKFIATVPKKGYRLVGAVEDSAQAASDAVSPKAATSIARHIWPVAIGLLGGIALAAALFWRPQTLPASIKLISTFPGSHSQPSFAPDGEGFAFVSDADGTPHVWVLEPSEPAARQVTKGGSADSRPRWSPDGRSILFIRDNGIWSIPAAGGEATEIIRDGYNPNWSNDGERIVFERRYQVWTADSGGGGQQRVSGIPRRELALTPRWPAFSPDGTHIVYFGSEDTPQGDLWVIPAGGGEPERLTFAPSFGSAPVWSPDGDYIIYSSQRGGSRTLWRVDVLAKTSEPLLVGSGDDDFPDVAADGNHLIYSNSRERFTLVVSDPESGTHSHLYESRQPLVGPDLSPDRKTVAFFGAARAGGYQIFTLPLTGGTPTMLTSDPQATHALPQWSSDGASLYFFHTLTDTSFSKVSAAGGQTEPVVDGWNWNVANGARVEPGERNVIYSRLTGQTPVQTLIRNLATAKDSTFYATLEYPRWSADGTMLTGSLFVDQSFPGDVAVCPAAGSKCRTVASKARIPVWSSNESQVYFVRGFGKSQDLYVVPADGSAGERKLMTMAPLFPLGPFYDITEDGSIVWVRHDAQRSELLVAELTTD